MRSRSFRSRSRDRKYRKYEYSSYHPRHRSTERKYSPRERLSDYRDRSRERRYRSHSRSYSRERSYERRRDRRSYDRYSGRRDGREVRRYESHREERYREERHRDYSDRHRHHRYDKYERSPSRSSRKRRLRSRSVSMGRRGDRRTPSETAEKVTVPAPPGEHGRGSSSSGTSNRSSKMSKASESSATKPTPNTDRTLTVMRDGKIITSTITPVVKKETSSVASTKVDNPLISGVKLDPETIAKRGLTIPVAKVNIEVPSNKDAPNQVSSTQDKEEKDTREDILSSFPPPKHYKKLTKFFDPLPKFGSLAPSMYFPLDGAKLRRYKAYKVYNDKLRRYDDIKFQRKQLMDLVRFDFDYFKLKLEVCLKINSNFQVLKVDLTTSKLCYIV